jgi:hypothetical protein
VAGARPVLALLLLAAGGCRPSEARRAAPPPESDPLRVDAVALAQSDPRCAQKVARDPFAYFRYTNRPFVDLVCTRWASAITSMPMVIAHGDAHLEQYAVAAEGRGLADFDASSVGPPIVDLARFSTSIVLASRKDDGAARRAIDAFLRGYLRALEDPLATVPEPASAQRLRSRFEPTTVEWLDRIEKMIVPTPMERRGPYEAGWNDFVGQMRAKDPSIGPAFFTIKVGGRLDAGLGSAHTEKFLVRVEGPSPLPDDDLVLEAKALQPGALGSCMRGVDLDATRVIKGQTQISNAPQRFLAAMKIDGKAFYSHTWLVHYQELSASDVASGTELAELAEDVGIQLGRGHTKVQDASRLPQLRQELKHTVEVVSPRLASDAFELAAEVTRAWGRYRAALPR